LRILVLGSKGLPPVLGVERVVAETASRYAAAGHSVTVAGHRAVTGGIESWNGCRILSTGGPSRGPLSMPWLAVASVLSARRSGSGFDAVHFHSVDPFMLARPLLAWPVLVTSHGRAYLRAGEPPGAAAMSRLAESAFLRHGAGTAVSPVDAAYYAGSCGRPVEYVPNGMPAAPAARSSPGDGYIFLSAGRLIPSKGVHLAIEAYRRASPGLPLLVAGAPGRNPGYAARLVRCSPPGVRWLGMLGPGEHSAMCAGASLLLFTSLYEAQSMTLLELVSSGGNLVYSDIPENEAVAAGLGRAFRSGDPASLASVLVLALSEGPPGDPSRLEALRAFHDWDRSTARYLELLAGAAVPAR
jgi:glycosyltransferase involved in cell wall biosynthesis